MKAAGAECGITFDASIIRYLCILRFILIDQKLTMKGFLQHLKIILNQESLMNLRSTKKCVLPHSPASSPHNRCFNSYIISDTPKFSHGHMTSHMNVYMAPIIYMC